MGSKSAKVTSWKGPGYIYRVGAKFRAQIQIRTKRFSQNFDVQAEAEKYLRDKERNFRHDGFDPDTSKITWGAVVMRFLQEKQLSVKKTTLQDYRVCISGASAKFGSIPVLW